MGGYAQLLGMGPVLWATRKQKTVAALSCEAEYTAVFEAAQAGKQLNMMIEAPGYPADEATTIFCNN